MKIARTGPTQAATSTRNQTEVLVAEEQGAGDTATPADRATLGATASPAVRAGAGVASLALHAPQVAFGPLFTPRASSQTSAAGAGLQGYIVANGLGAGLAAGLVTQVLTGSPVIACVAGGAAASATALTTAVVLGSISTTDSERWGLTSVAEKKQAAFERTDGSLATKSGQAFKAGFEESGRFYYQKGVRTADQITGFIDGFKS